MYQSKHVISAMVQIVVLLDLMNSSRKQKIRIAVLIVAKQYGGTLTTYHWHFTSATNMQIGVGHCKFAMDLHNHVHKPWSTWHGKSWSMHYREREGPSD